MTEVALPFIHCEKRLKRDVFAVKSELTHDFTHIFTHMWKKKSKKE